MGHILPGAGGMALMDADDAGLLLLDHQSGLFQTAKDISVAELRANVSALTRIATLPKQPMITKASVREVSNGTLMAEIANLVPHAIYAPHQVEMDAWE
jgi:hypothetical protein